MPTYFFVDLEILLKQSLNLVDRHRNLWIQSKYQKCCQYVKKVFIEDLEGEKNSKKAQPLLL